MSGPAAAELLRRLIRDAGVNDGPPGSGNERRSVLAMVQEDERVSVGSVEASPRLVADRLARWRVMWER